MPPQKTVIMRLISVVVVDKSGSDGAPSRSTKGCGVEGSNWLEPEQLRHSLFFLCYFLQFHCNTQHRFQQHAIKWRYLTC